ncbi:MAG: hypothetical protein AB2606_12270 [Candidatus Thiodiazotropha taylori]
MKNDQEQNQSEALQWIVSLLNQHRIPFLICGGLAAVGYGSKRELNDIDLFVPGELFKKVVLLGNEHFSNLHSAIARPVKDGIWNMSNLSIVVLKLKSEIQMEQIFTIKKVKNGPPSNWTFSPPNRSLYWVVRSR